MNPVIAPINPGDKGSSVSNLQEGLIALITQGVIRSLDAPNYPTADEIKKLTEELRMEKEQAIFGEATRELVLILQVQQGLGDNLIGRVEEKTADVINKLLKLSGELGNGEDYEVSGRIMDVAGKFLTGMRVQAYDRDLRKEQLLGEAITDAEGHYQIHYTAQQFIQADASAHEAPDLMVRVLANDQQTLTESNTKFNAGLKESVDLTIPAQTISEWEELSNLILPLLKGQSENGENLMPDELVSDDLAFISSETEIQTDRLQQWVDAFKMGREISIKLNRTQDFQRRNFLPTNQGWASGIVMVCYGWLRQGISTDIVSLAQGQDEQLVSLLKKSIDEKFIPKLEAEWLKIIPDLLSMLRLSLALRPAEEGNNASLGDALRIIPNADSLQLDDLDGLGGKIVSHLSKNNQHSNSAWNDIRNLINDEKLFLSVQRSVGLWQLTNGHEPLMKTLLGTDTNESSATLKDLVAADTKDWIGLATKYGSPKQIEASSEEERAIKYGTQLAKGIQRLHPGAYIQNRIDSGRIPVADDLKETITKFISVNPSLRFRDGSVLAFLSSENVNTEGLAEEKISAIKPELLKIERLARLTSNLENVGPMINMGFEAARDIVVRHGKEAFVNRMSSVLNDEHEALEIYKAAAGAVAASEGIVMMYGNRFTGIDLPVMPKREQKQRLAISSRGTAAALRTLIQPGNLQQLFGSQDYCECGHGASLFGAAAYLADLLQMLARGVSFQGKTALDVLIQRRPDLVEIDLTGDNTDTVLPYIDLVLEILESPNWEAGIGIRVLRGGTKQNPNNDFDAPLTSGTIPQALADDLASWGLNLSDNVVASKAGKIFNTAGVKLDSWQIKDLQSGLKIRLIGAVYGAYRVRASYQSIPGMITGYQPWSKFMSKTSAGIAKARFPWILPFDADRDEANAWLEHLGSNRTEVLMRLLDADNFTDTDAACEFLDISRAERDIFTNAPDTLNPGYKDWGFAAATNQTVFDPVAGVERGPGTWHELLKNVSLLRSRAQINHRELLNLLETRFVSGGDLPLQVTGQECHTGSMRLELMDEAIARRTHLFVRLWKKLGWKTNTIDLAINVFGNGTVGTGSAVTFNETFVNFLANVSRLNVRTRIPVEQILDLVGNTLNTKSYYDHSGAKPSSVLSRYRTWFDNNTLRKPQLAEFHLNAAGNQLQTIPRPAAGLPKPRISDHISYVSAALNLAEEQLTLMLPRALSSITPVQITTQPQAGEAVDVSKASTKEIEIVNGAISTGASSNLLIEESSDGLTFSGVSVGNLQGTANNPVVISSASPLLGRIKYSGNQKYLRVSVSPATTGNIWIECRVILENGIVSDELSLANLTTICRYALLTRVTGKKFTDIQSLIRLTNANPILSNDPTTLLVLLNNSVVLSGLDLTVSDAVKLMFGNEGDDLFKLEQNAEKLLVDTRAAAQAIENESTVAADKRSVLLNKILTESNWNNDLISSVLATDGLSAVWNQYESPLDELPSGVTLPNIIQHETQAKRLVVSKAVRPKDLLQAISTVLPQATGDLEIALNSLKAEANSREAFLNNLQEKLRAKTLPEFRVSLTTIPNLNQDAATWKERFFYDRNTKELCFIGWMSEGEKISLKSLETISTPAFTKAIDDLFTAQSQTNYSVAADNKLVIREGGSGGYLTIEELIIDTSGLEDRSGRLLAILLTEWRSKKLREKLDQLVSQVAGIPVDKANALLDLPHTIVNTNYAFGILLADPDLISSNESTRPTRSAFPQAFDAACRVMLLGAIIRKMDESVEFVSWLAKQWDGIDLSNIPITKVTTGISWNTIKAIHALKIVNNEIGPDKLASILDQSEQQQLDFSSLALILGISEENFRKLAGPSGLNIANPSWLNDPLHLLKLVSAVNLLKQLRISSNTFLNLKKVQMVARPVAEAEAEVKALRQVAISSSKNTDWSESEKKVLDKIRQKRRDAASTFLVNTFGFRDLDDLYGYYLIDPKMGPVMMTSRIKQAISSVQLFTQRCLMSLEPDAPPYAINKDHWEWMKNYRVWEANRKVLLYPENWIEPELRDDKTPFFDDLISSLLQNDATSDKAVQATGTFLEKLTELSRVRIVASCSKYDDNKHLLSTYLFGKTNAEPHTYWYRQFINQDPEKEDNSVGVWTPWKQITVDIDSDHLFPFVWQGRLFLFWAKFSEEAVEADPSKPATKSQKFWNLKIAWSEYKSGAWSSRHVYNERSLYLKLDVNYINSSSFYFSTILANDGVTIKLYWVPDPLTLVLPDPFNKFKPHESPITILFFDGDHLKLGAALQRVLVPKGGNQLGFVESIMYGDTDRAEVPYDLTAGTIANHRQMEIQWDKYTSVMIPVKGMPGSLQVFQKPAPRALRLMYTPEIGKPLIAPGIKSNGSFSQATVPFTVSDWIHQFFVYPIMQPTSFPYVDGNGQITQYAIVDVPRLHFYQLDWPQSKRFRKTLSSEGIGGLLSFKTQDKVKNPPVDYFKEYFPEYNSIIAYPAGDLDFSIQSATAQYNYELFFHVPFAIACSLSKNQRFEEARQWFHYVFDPTDASSDPSPDRYWRFRPFREFGQGIKVDDLVRKLADENDQSSEKLEFKTLIALWKDEPFKPHLVARMRIRSYMYTVVMKYLDNLIAWGDQLFRRDTLESLNEATQLYILAAQILGRRPEGIPPRTQPKVKSYADFETIYVDDLSNALVEAENIVPRAPSGGNNPSPGLLNSLYFCCPNNPKILGYYDLVEDRLFKLRNSLNIDGVFRQLPLFEPAIDPSLLVRAAAAGINVGAVLADLQAPLPFYRFQVMIQKAVDFCSEVRSLGASLLAAIEKEDAEALSLMRSGQEIQMLQNLRLVKEIQLQEAKANMDALGVSLESAQKKFTHYIGLVSQMDAVSIPSGPAGPTVQGLASMAVETLNSVTSFAQAVTNVVDPITVGTLELTKQILSRAAQALAATLPAESADTAKVPMNAAEKHQLQELKLGHDLQQKAMDQRMVAQILALIPDFTMGASGIASPVVTFQLGGTLLSAFANIQAAITDSKSSEHNYRANLHSILAGYQRRADEWMLQAELAAKEIEQISTQLKAATLRIAIASQELRNHDLQAQNAQEVDEFMRTKFSNKELHSWMSGQISALHFRAYQLAFEVAKRAERCFRHELGVETSFIKFGYWDSLRKGLLAGDNLLSDIKRMEAAYLNQNARDIEITKHVSLRQLDPMALLELRRTGKCEFDVGETIFDLDFPGHYYRRIKNVSVSVPCIAGPYSSVNGTLTLLSSRIRTKNIPVQNNYTNEDNFRTSYLPVQSIATSSGVNDPGMFELNFRDDRYLPFEGAGVISRWRFQLPGNYRAFDYDTISDVILHIKYTARDGGVALSQAATNYLATYFQMSTPSPSVRMLSLRTEFPTEWYRFLYPSNAQNGNSLDIELSGKLFPYRDSRRTVQINSIGIVAKCTHKKNYEIRLIPPLQANQPALTADEIVDDLEDPTMSIHYFQKDVSADGINIQAGTAMQWKLKMSGPNGAALAFDAVKKEMEIEDLFLILGYRT